MLPLLIGGLSVELGLDDQGAVAAHRNAEASRRARRRGLSVDVECGDDRVENVVHGHFEESIG
jgi:hypothetical protein